MSNHPHMNNTLLGSQSSSKEKTRVKRRKHATFWNSSCLPPSWDDSFKTCLRKKWTSLMAARHLALDTRLLPKQYRNHTPSIPPSPKHNLSFQCSQEEISCDVSCFNWWHYYAVIVLDMSNLSEMLTLH